MKRDPQRAIAMQAARELDRVVAYLRSGRAEDALRVAIYAAHRIRRRTDEERRTARNELHALALHADTLPS
jgi:hypothetical protein